jgi:hypothetical protein
MQKIQFEAFGDELCGIIKEAAPPGGWALLGNRLSRAGKAFTANTREMADNAIGAAHGLANPVAGIRQGLSHIKGQSGSTAGKFFTGLSLVGTGLQVPDAVAKEDPTGLNRSRGERIGRLVGSTAGSIIGAPFGITGGIMADAAGTYAGSKAGQLASYLSDKAKAKRMAKTEAGK